MTPRWWLAHIVLLALVFAAHQAGLVVQTWRADQTYLTAIIAVVWGLGILASAFNHWDAVEWLAQRCFQLGLIGTVLGFIIALSGVDPEQAQNLAATTRGILAGEYQANVHLFSEHGCSPMIPVWVGASVRRPDQKTVSLAATEVQLTHTGHEITAFRFRLTEAGAMVPGSLHALPRALRSVTR
jgi:hypothetical protein